MSQEDAEKFLDMLENPDPPTDKLIEAMKGHKPKYWDTYAQDQVEEYFKKHKEKR